MSPRKLVLAGAAMVCCVAAGPVGVGTKLTPADLAGVFAYPPSGAGLPPGRGTPATGAAVYAQNCAACHGENLLGQKSIGAPALIGGRGTLARVPVLGSPPSNLPVKTVESYWPYATTLFDYIKRAMPMNAPGSLSNDQVYGVTAYILAQARIVKADAVIDATTLPAVRMPNRDGFVSAGPRFR
jgi:cytochrome c